MTHWDPSSAYALPRGMSYHAVNVVSLCCFLPRIVDDGGLNSTYGVYHSLHKTLRDDVLDRSAHLLTTKELCKSTCDSSTTG